MHEPGSFTAQTPREDRVRNQAEDLGHSGFIGCIHQRISGSMFCVIRRGSLLMPNTRQLDRFFPRIQKLQIQPYLLTKVKIGKVVEEFAHVDAHCFAMYNISIKKVKNRDNFVLFVQNNFLSRPLHFFL